MTFKSNDDNLLTFLFNLFSSQVDNQFCDIFVSLCYVGFLINDNGQKLTDR